MLKTIGHFGKTNKQKKTITCFTTFVTLTFTKQGVNKEKKYILEYIIPFLLTSYTKHVMHILNISWLIVIIRKKIIKAVAKWRWRSEMIVKQICLVFCGQHLFSSVVNQKLHAAIDEL